MTLICQEEGDQILGVTASRTQSRICEELSKISYSYRAGGELTAANSA